MRSSSRPTWDVFCKIVDNFGDIGVCWRFSRQLAMEHDLAVRLWIDDLRPFQRINRLIDPVLSVQSNCGVEVRRWEDPFPPVMPADVVVEAFGCEVPALYQSAMASKKDKSAWINLEYLSAESWVNGCHTLASPHPRLPLTKYYFFPGFVPGTGGLLHERDLIKRRDAFRRDAAAMNVFWQSLSLPPRGAAEIRISLFCYENPAIPSLLDAWASGSERILCVVPEGLAVERVKAFFKPNESFSLRQYRRGNLEVRVLPFFEQVDYDRLLWACDCNFVRGEDSFVRSQWALAPFVWHIYPQKENIHWIKLDAFLDRYCAGMAAEAAADLRLFWRSWNDGRGAGEAWAGFWRRRAQLQAHAEAWAKRLVAQGDLAANVVQFSHKLLKY